MNKKLIEKSVIALATCKNNKPHVIPIACAKVIGNKIILADNFMKKTKENIKKNKNVAPALWKGEKEYKIGGTANYYNKGKWPDYVKNLKENKGFPTKGAVVIKIKRIPS